MVHTLGDIQAHRVATELPQCPHVFHIMQAPPLPTFLDTVFDKAPRTYLQNRESPPQPAHSLSSL